jgi:hypothetical protein
VSEHRPFSVLTKSLGLASTPAPSETQTAGLLERLPGGDKWTQYPPASGRGHAFETRFWMNAADADDAAVRGAVLVMAAQAAVGLGAWQIVRVHAASLAERAIEFYPGLEAHHEDGLAWSVMHRCLLAASEGPAEAPERARILDAIPGESKVVAGARRMLELRFWVTAPHAVAAAAEAERNVAVALGTVKRLAWTTIRLQTASVSERRRELYLGVERRLGERADP